jgi:hypothetical protein
MGSNWKRPVGFLAAGAFPGRLVLAARFFGDLFFVVFRTLFVVFLAVHFTFRFTPLPGDVIEEADA